MVPPAALLTARLLVPLVAKKTYLYLLLLLGVSLSLRSVPYFLPNGIFLRGAAPYVEAAHAASKVMHPKETLFMLDNYFSIVQYYSGHRTISYWTSPKIESQMQRIPYIRYGKNMRYADPRTLHHLVLKSEPGIWFLPPVVVSALNLEARGRIVYANDVVVVVNTR